MGGFFNISELFAYEKGTSSVKMAMKFGMNFFMTYPFNKYHLGGQYDKLFRFLTLNFKQTYEFCQNEYLSYHEQDIWLRFEKK